MVVVVVLVVLFIGVVLAVVVFVVWRELNNGNGSLINVEGG